MLRKHHMQSLGLRCTMLLVPVGVGFEGLREPVQRWTGAPETTWNAMLLRVYPREMSVSKVEPC